MATNIYVGNLPWSTTTDDLYAMFQQYGQVTRAQVVTDRETGRSRGFGFVEMPNEPEAQAAIAALNKTSGQAIGTDAGDEQLAAEGVEPIVFKPISMPPIRMGASQ